MAYSLTDSGVSSNGGPVKFYLNGLSTPTNLVLSKNSLVEISSYENVSSRPSPAVGSYHWYRNSSRSSITLKGTYLYTELQSSTVSVAVLLSSLSVNSQAPSLVGEKRSGDTYYYLKPLQKGAPTIKSDYQMFVYRIS